MAKGRRGSQRRQTANSRYGRRAVRTRAPLPILIIVCDDSATAPNYFNALKREVKDAVTIKIVPASCSGSSPRVVVDRALCERKSLRRDQQGNEHNRDSIWALIDLEHEAHQRAQAEDAKQYAAGKGVRVVQSDPCYEIWTLLHLEDTGAAFATCAKVITHLKHRWREEFGESFDHKSHADHLKILGHRSEAAARAKRHHEAGDPSWTEVYKVIETVVLHSEQTGLDRSL